MAATALRHFVTEVGSSLQGRGRGTLAHCPPWVTWMEPSTGPRPCLALAMAAQGLAQPATWQGSQETWPLTQPPQFLATLKPPCQADTGAVLDEAAAGRVPEGTAAHRKGGGTP